MIVRQAIRQQVATQQALGFEGWVYQEHQNVEHEVYEPRLGGSIVLSRIGPI
jgi:hypothetical protein